MGTEGFNALHLAIQFKHADLLLFLCAAHPSLVDAPTASEKGSMTPLMILVEHWGKQRPGKNVAKKLADMLRALVAFGANVNVAAKGSGSTALHLAMGIKSDLDCGAVVNELLLAGAKLDATDAAGNSPRSIAGARPRRDAVVSQYIQKEDCKLKVPSAAGFWTAWVQIGSGAVLTTMLGWALGCAAFAIACGASSVVSSATRAATLRIQHGFASGSIFFIVGSFCYYLYDTVSNIFVCWYVASVALLVYFFVKTTYSDRRTSAHH